jgi:hypothetical protein
LKFGTVLRHHLQGTVGGEEMALAARDYLREASAFLAALEPVLDELVQADSGTSLRVIDGGQS